MKTTGFIIFTAMLTLQASAQDDKYANTFTTTKGKIHFFSSGPIEDIEATSNVAMGVLNTQTGKVSAKVSMESFVFKDKLMQEHFNENYMESDRYPSGILDMTIAEKLDYTKDGCYLVTLKGTFEVHGVKVPREIKATLTIKNGEPVSATADFEVKLADHKIKIPKAVIMNIAEVIKVDVAFSLEKYKK